MEHLGVDRPTDISTALGLPETMARLLAERGEGVLCATLRLRVPGSAGHALIAEQLAAARAAFEGTTAWLTLRSARGPRSVLLGEGLGSFLMLDPAPRDDGQPLWLLHRNGTALEVGRDLEDLTRVVTEGALHSVSDHLLSLEVRKDPSALSIPLQYDTRDEGSAEAFLAALHSGDDDACDVAFEHFASARSVGQCVVEAREIFAKGGVSEPSRREWSKTLDRIATRNPIAVRVAEQGAVVPALDALLAHMEQVGLRSGGVVHERAAHALEGRGLVVPFSSADVDEALASLDRLSVESRDALRFALKQVLAVDAVVMLSAILNNLAFHTVATNRLPIAVADLPDASETWPFLLIAMGGSAFRGAGPSCVRALATVDEPLIARVLEERLLLPDPSWNSVEQIAAALVVQRNPPTEERARVWFDAIRRAGKTPKRYRQSESASTFALLEHSVMLDSVMEFFIQEHNRAPYAAFNAAGKRGNSRLARDLLVAICSGTAPVPLRLHAATMAADWGDARARAAVPTLEKSMTAHSRRMDSM